MPTPVFSAVNPLTAEAMSLLAVFTTAWPAAELRLVVPNSLTIV